MPEPDTTPSADPIDPDLTGRPAPAGQAPSHAAPGSDTVVAELQRELDACRRRLGLLADHGSTAMLVFDVAGRILETNPAARTVLGLAPGQERDMLLVDLAAPLLSGTGLFPESWGEDGGSGVPAGWRLKRADGEWVSAVVQVARLNGVDSGRLMALF